MNDAPSSELEGGNLHYSCRIIEILIEYRSSLFRELRDVLDKILVHRFDAITDLLVHGSSSPITQSSCKSQGLLCWCQMLCIIRAFSLPSSAALGSQIKLGDAQASPMWYFGRCHVTRPQALDHKIPFWVVIHVKAGRSTFW